MMPWMKSGTRGLLATLLWAACGLVQAACSRPIDAPLSPMGLIGRVESGRAEGIYADLLKEAGLAAGCEFHFIDLPRARAQKLFETGETDLLLPAVPMPSRNAHGEFVPLLRVRPVLIAFKGALPTALSTGQLMADRALRVAVVRGFSYGTAYDDLTQALSQQGRLSLQADVAGVIKALRRHTADACVINPAILLGELLMAPDGPQLWSQLQISVVSELPWTESGVYLSSETLAEADRRALREALTQTGKASRAWELFSSRFPRGSLDKAIQKL